MFGGQQVCVLLINPFHMVIHYNRKQILYWPLIQKMKSYDTLYTMSVITLKILNKTIILCYDKRDCCGTRGIGL